ncbi:MAG: MFS transporter [Deltaproteobacteria bacterium]|nr:MFS transporter [Deltaproteobacteria bacterium]
MKTPLAATFDVSPLVKENTGFKVLGAIGFSHLLNDMIQSLLPAIYPLLKSAFFLNFTQIGLITLTFQITASLLQPMVGLYTDHHPKPYSLSIGMGCTLTGLLILAFAPSYGILLIAAALVGTGSSIFHPESSRVARMASGGRYGLAQSIFQVGGNAGSATGPLLAALIIIPQGRHSIAWFSLVALLAMLVLWQVGGWYKRQQSRVSRPDRSSVSLQGAIPARTVARSMVILLVLIFSKFFYLASLNSYYIFFLIRKFHVSVQSAQIHLFVFLSAVALGTIIGGHVGDRIGRKRVIWISILGVAPFTLILPHVNLAWTGPLTFIIGLILSSAFPAILVFAQELLPGKVGTVAGLFFGLAFGMAGIGAAVLGKLADVRGIEYVYQVCAFLPLFGLLAVFLPDIGRPGKRAPILMTHPAMEQTDTLSIASASDRGKGC